MKIQLGENYFDIQPLYPGSVITKPAVYTIWTFDPSSEDYQLLYVGECGSSGVVLDETHEYYEDWSNCQISSLYIDIHEMPEEEYSKEERQQLSQFFIELYRPLCNVQIS